MIGETSGAPAGLEEPSSWLEPREQRSYRRRRRVIGVSLEAPKLTPLAHALSSLLHAKTVVYIKPYDRAEPGWIDHQNR
jgi:hypothetical protein